MDSRRSFVLLIAFMYRRLVLLLEVGGGGLLILNLSVVSGIFITFLFCTEFVFAIVMRA